MHYAPLLRTVLLATCSLALCQSALARRPHGDQPADAAAREQAWQRHQTMQQNSPYQGLQWRSIGPVVQGGRVVDVESVPGEPYTFYVAYASGGLWKTSNNGVSFEPLFDQMPTMVMGDIAVDPQHPQTIWVGTGEPQSSRSSYGGMGLFRSDDGGQTWQAKGLDESDRIAKIYIDPRNSQRILVAALGRLYSDGGERGLYLTEDGGEHWRHVLAGDAQTGAIDLVQHPDNPDILYAATWQRSRSAWNFIEGGRGSGIWRSADAGKTWQRIGEGFPQGDLVGRIGLAVSAAAPDTLYAVVDNQEALDEEEWDLGDQALSAKRLRNMSKEEFLSHNKEDIEFFIRANDFTPELDADALIEMLKSDALSMAELIDTLGNANANLFTSDIRGLELYRSDDRGDHWYRTHQQPMRDVVYTYGYYFGQVRAAPDDVNRVYLLGVPMITSGDGGKTFSGLNGRNVHGDHHSLWIDQNNSQRMLLGNDGGLDITYDGGKSWLQLDAQPVGQFYSIAVDMAEPYNVYGGLQDNGTYRGASTTRWQDGTSWTKLNGGDGMQVQIDPRDNQTIYTGYQFGNYVRLGQGRSTVRPRNGFREEPLRYNWNSPILLSSHHPDVLYFGTNKLFRSFDQGDTWTALSGDLSRSKQRGDVPFASLTTIAESPLKFGLLWAGTDDGELWVSESGGERWRNAAEKLPAERWISRVEASQHQQQRAYVSLNGYRNDDIRAYVYRTDDLGKHWQDISAGLPAEAVNVIREDPLNPDLVYVGTDRGVYASLDQGKHWQALDSQLPNVPVHDLVVHPRERELVAGTHGRSAWVVDVLPLQDLTTKVQESPLHVFYVDPVQASRQWNQRPSAWYQDPADADRVMVHYWSREAGPVQLEIRNEAGDPVRHLSFDARAGINRLEWDLLMDQQLAEAAEAASNAEREVVEVRHRPVAEALRLGHPLYALPGKYQLHLCRAELCADGELQIKAPSPPRPRTNAKAAIRGR